MTDIKIDHPFLDMGLKRSSLWREYIVSPDEKTAYCIVPKNRSNTYRKLLLKNGWKGTRSKPTNVEYIAHIQDPVNRWVKGFVQYCVINQMSVRDTLAQSGNILPAIIDNHTMPISHIHHDIYDQIKFFKLGTNDMEEYLGLEIPEHHYNQADPARIEDYQLVHDFLNYERRQIELSAFIFYDLLKFQDVQ